jgi:hypothetical protein
MGREKDAAEVVATICRCICARTQFTQARIYSIDVLCGDVIPVEWVDHDVVQAPHATVGTKQMIDSGCVSILDAPPVMGHPIGPVLLAVVLEQFAEFLGRVEKLGAGPLCMEIAGHGAYGLAAAVDCHPRRT